MTGLSNTLVLLMTGFAACATVQQTTPPTSGAPASSGSSGLSGSAGPYSSATVAAASASAPSPSPSASSIAPAGACFRNGQWTASGDWGPAGDGCNRSHCVDGRWTTVTLLDCRTQISERISFSAGSTVVPATASPILDAVADVMKSRPDITSVEIVGRATTNEPKPDELSRKRANAVRDALVSRGVDTSRLIPNGYGVNQPLADPKLPDSGAINRSLSFIVHMRLK